MRTKILQIFLLLFPLFGAFPMAGVFKGVVVDSATAQPLWGVNVFIPNTVIGTVTDEKGIFSLSPMPPGKHQVKFSLLGYQSALREVVLGEGDTLQMVVPLHAGFLRANPVVVTANKYAQEGTMVPQSIAVLTNEDFIRYHTRKLEESLGLVSGIHFNEENISIRGSSGYSVFNVGSRVLLLVDGVSVLTSDLGAINWKTLPLLDIERIEIVKGAGSALYGSSAMGGVINLITREPSRSGKFQMRLLSGFYDKPHYAIWQWTNRTLHYERADLTYSKAFGPIGMRLSFTRFRSTGYMENNEANLWNLGARFTVRFANASKLTLYVTRMANREGGFIQWLNQNKPFQVSPFNKKDKIEYQAQNVIGIYHLPLSAKLGLKCRFSYLETELGNQLTRYQPGAFEPGRGPGGEVQLDWVPHILHHLTLGTEFRYDATGSQYFGHHRGYTFSSYVQHVWKPHVHLTVTSGAREDIHVLLHESTEDRFSPKLGLNYTPCEKITFRTSVGAGFRSATVFEKYIQADYSGFNVIPNPKLRSERSWFGDFGFSYTDPSCTFEASFFQSNYWDMIEPVIDFRGTIQFQNYVRARIRGIEWMAEMWRFKKRIGLRGTLTWLDPVDLLRKEILPYRPRWAGTAILFLNFWKTSFQAEYRYASRIENVMIQPLDPRVPVKLVHLRFEYRTGMWTLQASLHNALNYHYAQIERRMGEIRNVSLGLTVEM